jgi:hypothetical protein
MSCQRSMRWVLAVVLVSGGTLISSSRAGWAGEAVKVLLRNGRTFSGELDPRSDSLRLWLKFSGRSIALYRSFAWNQVQAAWRGQDELPIRELEQLALALEVKTRRQRAEDRDGRAKPNARSAGDNPYRPAEAPPAIVREVRLQARAANWDDDAEADGLLLQLYPLGDDGLVVPVAGFLEVTLVGQRIGPPAGGESFPQLGRWRRAIEPGDVQPGGVTLRLPFQAAHPEFDLGLSALGMVQTRFAISGQAAFETSSGTFSIRPMNALRDDLEQRQRRRFFPWERTSAP